MDFLNEVYESLKEKKFEKYSTQNILKNNNQLAGVLGIDNDYIKGILNYVGTYLNIPLKDDYFMNIINVKGDGNCGLYAALVGFYLEDKNDYNSSITGKKNKKNTPHMYVRKEIIRLLGEGTNKNQKQTKINEIKNNKSWVGNEELLGKLPKIFNKTIKIISIDGIKKSSSASVYKEFVEDRSLKQKDIIIINTGGHFKFIKIRKDCYTGNGLPVRNSPNGNEEPGGGVKSNNNEKINFYDEVNNIWKNINKYEKYKPKNILYQTSVLKNIFGDLKNIVQIGIKKEYTYLKVPLTKDNKNYELNIIQTNKIGNDGLDELKNIFKEKKIREEDFGFFDSKPKILNEDDIILLKVRSNVSASNDYPILIFNVKSKSNNSGTQQKAKQPNSDGAQPHTKKSNNSGTQQKAKQPNSDGAQPHTNKSNNSGAQRKANQTNNNGAQPHTKKSNGSGTQQKARQPNNNGAQPHTNKPNGSGNAKSIATNKSNNSGNAKSIATNKSNNSGLKRNNLPTEKLNKMKRFMNNNNNGKKVGSISNRGLNNNNNINKRLPCIICGGGLYVYVSNVGKRKLRYTGKGKKYVMINGKRKYLK